MVRFKIRDRFKNVINITMLVVIYIILLLKPFLDLLLFLLERLESPATSIVLGKYSIYTVENFILEGLQPIINVGSSPKLPKIFS